MQPAAWRGGANSQLDWSAGLHLTLKDDSVFSLFDRRVKVEGDEEAASLYTLCRRWVQNDPEQDQDTPPPPVVGMRLPPAAAALPPLPESSAAPVEAPLNTADGATTPPIEELQQHHNAHWKRVRQHHQAAREPRALRAQQRLAALLPAPHSGGQVQLLVQQPESGAAAGDEAMAEGAAGGQEGDAAQ